MREVVEKIKGYLHRLVPPYDEILVPKGSPIPLGNSFSPLPEPLQSSLHYVDGGIAEILVTPHLGVFFNRICSLHFLPQKQLQIQEFYTIIATQKTNNEIFYKVECLPPIISQQIIHSEDPCFTVQHSRASITSIANYIRRCAELEYAKKKLKSSTMVVLDGSRIATTDKEEAFFLSLSKTCRENDSILVAFSKTCSWLTTEGWTALDALQTRASQPTWFYQHHNIAFVRFDPQSKYIFKLESEDIQRCIQHLLPHTTDAAFLGYPYGLLLVDKFARVSEKERQQKQIQFRALLQDDWDSLLPAANAMSAHAILDSL